MLEDEKFMEFVFTLFNNYNAKVFYNLYFHLYENFVFNSGDVVQNMLDAEDNLRKRDFTPFGINIGNIVADLFYHNPNDYPHWKEKFSVTVKKPGYSKKIKSKYFESIKVSAENPNAFSIINNFIDFMKYVFDPKHG